MTSFTAQPDRQEVVVTRTFDAPRELVFSMFTDPDAIRRWWGLGHRELVIDRMEVRPGGRWRYVDHDENGVEYGFHGVYHQITPPERLVYTFEYEDTPARVVLETVTLEDAGGRTKVTVTSVFQSVADRDWMVDHGMESGKRRGMDVLAELLEKARAG
ncbi:MAG: SRPBCC family protein [Mycobacteriales bacterium]